MALFEAYERRIDQINAVLNSYGTLRMKAAATRSIAGNPRF